MKSKSKELFTRAKKVIPAGVNSPVRAFHAVSGLPKVIKSGKSSYLTDQDGNSYLDFLGSWGPLILGHANSEVLKSIKLAASLGTSFGAPCEAEVMLAEEIVSSYPGIEQIRFVSSGTEAVMSAIRLARGSTKRDIVVKFSGCYHGHVDSLLVSAGSGSTTFNKPSSDGIPNKFTELTRVLPLDNEKELIELFSKEGSDIAAVIIEPIPANNGLLVQRKDYIKLLRDLCNQYGTLLIFDEVITGFRIGETGAAGYYDVIPDIATFGKVIGGGLPVGAFASRKNIMEKLAPIGGVYQAGTLSGNPVAMSAGLATLKCLKKENIWEYLENIGAYFESSINDIIKKSPFEIFFSRVGSIFWLSLHSNYQIRSAELIDNRSAKTFSGLFHALIDSGIYIAPSAYEVGFLSSVHTKEDINFFIERIEKILTNCSFNYKTGEINVKKI
ncbi:MAG: glutamate-1-semialdehyde 2,1-aminomutase [Pseudomonadota bacterium]|nr:aspartate aminotransferase family protein [Gammaproteobacteria bacterium]MEE2683737.1 glutamate-1-semialdehyde 2,1-aminomutase [Pseudomonadota bacterium]|tara:strand:+ start:1410 stop:2735 length:1326 start_codon:yes stop_codon:yes gene_type:complete